MFYVSLLRWAADYKAPDSLTTTENNHLEHYSVFHMDWRRVLGLSMKVILNTEEAQYEPL